MTITRTIDNTTHEIKLTVKELYEAWAEYNMTVERSHIVNYIHDNYEDDCHHAVYERITSAEEVEAIRKEAHFRADCDWGTFESEAEMMIDARIEELYEELGTNDYTD